MKHLKLFFIITDVGFILYWIITAAGILPQEYLFKDYSNPLMVAWNWSFLPLDLMISFTGLGSLYLYFKKNELWRHLALISLVLTFCSGLQAISFWAIRLDFDIAWWVINSYLLIYPPLFILQLLNGFKQSELEASRLTEDVTSDMA